MFSYIIIPLINFTSGAEVILNRCQIPRKTLISTLRFSSFNAVPTSGLLTLDDRLDLSKVHVLEGSSTNFVCNIRYHLSLPTSEGFTCLTAIIAVVVELALHFTMLRSVFSQCLGI
ncbi:hypothetical protein AVEN_134239-1 [Araneus ventricosus]|uniref:Uncharacterized protein n=1 Tax=Araneus ventricosus TaxID=182803 RepID=A0A4Y2IR73_ARAVE|nr:hypothetical protein AVEN_134239-1 [Araneus ventricosus]